MAELVAEEGVRAKGAEIHVAGHGDELSSGEVVEGQIVAEDLADFDDVLIRGCFSTRTDLNINIRPKAHGKRFVCGNKGGNTFRKNSANSSDCFVALLRYSPLS